MYSIMDFLRRRKRGAGGRSLPSAAFEALRNLSATFWPLPHLLLPLLILPYLCLPLHHPPTPLVIWNVPCISGGSCLSAEREEKGRVESKVKADERGRESLTHSQLRSLPECCSISSRCTYAPSLFFSLSLLHTHTHTHTHTLKAQITCIWGFFLEFFGGWKWFCRSPAFLYHKIWMQDPS